MPVVLYTFPYSVIHSVPNEQLAIRKHALKSTCYPCFLKNFREKDRYWGQDTQLGFYMCRIELVNISTWGLEESRRGIIKDFCGEERGVMVSYPTHD